MFMDELTKFRIVFLRAIAKAWMDPGWKGQLTGTDPVPVLQDTFPPYHWPWAQCDLKISDMGAKWNSATGSWYYDPERPTTLTRDIITVNLPLLTEDEKSARVTQGQQASALADYYQRFPSFLGSEANDPQTKATQTLGSSGIVNASDDFGFLDFGAITLSALALGWSQLDFSYELLTAGKARDALQNWLGYNNPWNFKLAFKNGKGTWDRKNGWQGLSNNILTLGLPQQPSVEIQAIALNAYNGTGAAYPFTCCP